MSESAQGPTVNHLKPIITQYISGFGHYAADQPVSNEFSLKHSFTSISILKIVGSEQG